MKSKNRNKNKSQLKSYITYDELEQLSFGSWLKKNAGTIGTVVGGAVGTLIAPGVGTQLGASIGGSIGGAVQQNEADKEAISAQNLQIQQQNATAQAQAEYQRLQNVNSQKTFTPLMEDGGNINQEQITNSNKTILEKNTIPPTNTNPPQNNNTDSQEKTGKDETFEEVVKKLNGKEKTLKNVKLHLFYDMGSNKMLSIRMDDEFDNEEDAKLFGARFFYNPRIVENYKNSIKYLGPYNFDELKVYDINGTYYPNFNEFLTLAPVDNVLKDHFRSTLSNKYKSKYPEVYELFYSTIDKINKLKTSSSNKVELLKIYYDYFVEKIQKTEFSPDKDLNRKIISNIMTDFNNAILSKESIFNLANEYGVPEKYVEDLYSKNSSIGLQKDNLDDNIVIPGVRVFFENTIPREGQQPNRYVFILDKNYSKSFHNNLSDLINYTYLDLNPSYSDSKNGTVSSTGYFGSFSGYSNSNALNAKVLNSNRLDMGSNDKGSYKIIQNSLPSSNTEENVTQLSHINQYKNVLKNLSDEVYKELGYDHLVDGTMDTFGINNAIKPEEMIKKYQRLKKPNSSLEKKEEGGIINYEGQTHQGPDGGIPIDEVGNPTVVSSNPPVALVEKGEVAFSHPSIGTYIFSNKLKYNNKKTFADKAKDIQRKYRLRMKDGKIIDSISEVAYNKEMVNLMKDQEIYREVSGINKEEKIKEQFRNQGIPIENNILPIGKNGIYIKPTKRNSYEYYLKNNPSLNELLINNTLYYPKKEYGALANTTVGLGDALLPAITSTIANSILANKISKRKIDQIKAPQITAPKVDSSSLRNTMIENTLAQEAQIRRNALLTGSSPQETQQFVSMNSNELNRNLNENLYKSYISDQEINAKNKLQADLANMEAKLQADKLNIENKLRKDQTIDLLRSSTANAWAQGFSEYLKGKKEFSTLNMQVKDYKLEPEIREGKFRFIDYLFPTLKKVHS